MIEFSELKEMPKALAKLQGEIENPKKDKKGMHNTYYATLDSVISEIKKVLSKNGFSVIQLPFNDGDNLGVETMLLHSSGEYIKSKYSMPIPNVNPQEHGKIITYYRRYALGSLFNMAPETDDDGDSAATNYNTGSKSQPNPGNPSAKPSEKQFGAMFYKVKDNSCGMDDFNNEVKPKANLAQYKWLMDNFTKQNFDGLVAKLKGGK